MHQPLLWLALLVVRRAAAAVINRLEGGNYGPNDRTGVSYIGTAGGSSLFVYGAGLGSPFNPPSVTVGNTPCMVDAYTSTSTQIHCVLQPLNVSVCY